MAVEPIPKFSLNYFSTTKMKSRYRASFGIYLLVIILTFSGTNADEPERIVSGKYTSIILHPYAVSIQVDGSHECNGAIISKSHILTAAHCVTYFETRWKDKNVTILTGTSNLLYGGQINIISDAFYHALYSPNLDTNYLMYDIGVIKLARPLIFTMFQKPINLPKSDVVADETVDIVGWGYVNVLNSSPSYILQTLKVKTLDTAICQKYAPAKYQNIFTPDFCTFHSYGSGTCLGDSGSPVVRGEEIVGVVSHGVTCALGYPDVQANVYRLRSFIHKAMSQ